MSQVKTKPIVFYIGHVLDTCDSETKTLCYKYKTNSDQTWNVLPTHLLKKFRYQPGFTYKIMVREIKHSSHTGSYELIKILSKTKSKETISKNATNQTSKGLPLASQWILESFENKEYKKPITKNSYLTISASLKEVSGHGGCNAFGGEVNTSGNRLTFTNLIRSDRYCLDTQGQEDLFFENLENTTHFKIIGGELFLYKNDTLLMTLESWR